MVSLVFDVGGVRLQSGEKEPVDCGGLTVLVAGRRLMFVGVGEFGANINETD